MRTLLTLALLACAATPAAAQMFAPVPGGRYYQPGYYGRSVVVRAPGTYVAVRPRVAYSYAPVAYSEPAYSQPFYSSSFYPQTYTSPVQVVSAPRVMYSTPTYSYPTYYSAPVYSTPTYYSGSTVTYAPPSYSYAPTYAYSTPPYTYSTPSYSYAPSYAYSTPVYSYPQTYAYSGQSYYGNWTPSTVPTYSSGFATYPQPTLNFVPSGDYGRRLLAPPGVRGGYAVRPGGIYYR